MARLYAIEGKNKIIHGCSNGDMAWCTYCGLIVGKTGTKYKPLLLDSLDQISCKRCHRSRDARDIELKWALGK